MQSVVVVGRVGCVCSVCGVWCVQVGRGCAGKSRCHQVRSSQSKPIDGDGDENEIIYMLCMEWNIRYINVLGQEGDGDDEG